VKQWEAFEHVHWGVLAHSTHLRGAETRDTVTVRARPLSRPVAGMPQAPGVQHQHALRRLSG
jgi:hypothetical protein